jgi:hypothetical protein
VPELCLVATLSTSPAEVLNSGYGDQNQMPAMTSSRPINRPDRSLELDQGIQLDLVTINRPVVVLITINRLVGPMARPANRRN